jgi:hypothetical protein
MGRQKTLSGKAFLVALLLYGSEMAFFDQTWKLMKTNSPGWPFVLMSLAVPLQSLAQAQRYKMETAIAPGITPDRLILVSAR